MAKTIIISVKVAITKLSTLLAFSMKIKGTVKAGDKKMKFLSKQNHNKKNKIIIIPPVLFGIGPQILKKTMSK